MHSKIPLSAVVFALLLAQVRADPAPAPPVAVAVIVEAEAATVSWLPSVEAAAHARHHVFGKHPDGSLEELATLPPGVVRAVVRAGFGEYGVAAEVDGRNSSIVFATPCVELRPHDLDDPVVVQPNCAWP